MPGEVSVRYGKKKNEDSGQHDEVEAHTCAAYVNNDWNFNCIIVVPIWTFF